MDAMERAMEAARKAVEGSYDGVCSVTAQRKVTDGKTKLTGLEDTVVLEGQPCHIVFKTVECAAQSDSAAAVRQVAELLISPDVSIEPGSKITVTQEGVTADYARSGIPAVYATHQEVMLEAFRGWA